VEKLEQNSFSKAIEKIVEIIQNIEEDLDGKAQQLEGIKSQIENATSVTECRALVNELMRKFLDMQGPHVPMGPLRDVVENAYEEMERILRDIEKLNKKDELSEKEKFEYREENFKDNGKEPPQRTEEEVKGWQKENKGKYYNDWFDLKKEWDKDRWYD
jgi:hypothetical protein